MSTNRRRIAGVLSIAVVAAIAVSGCSASPLSAGADDTKVVPYTKTDKTVEIQFWSSGIEDVNKQMADTFNATRGKDLNIHVTPTYQGDYGQAQQKVNAAALAKTLPNVFVDEVGMTKGFAQAKTITPVAPFLKAAKETDADFQVGATGNLSVDGEMYALPYMRSVPLEYVNTTLLSKLGLDTTAPKTLSDLETVLRAVHDKTGKPAMVMGNYDFWVMEALLYSYADLPVLNADETKSNLAKKGAVDMVTWFGKMVKDGVVQVDGPAQYQDFVASVGNPDIAVILTSSGGIQQLQQLAQSKGFSLDVGLFPSGDSGTRGVSVGGSNLYMANTGTDQEKAATFEFMNWATSTEQTAWASAQTGYIPVRKSAQDTDTMKQVYAKNPAYGVAKEELEYGKTRPMTTSYTEIQNLMVDKIDAMWANGSDPQTTMTALAKSVDAILAR